MEQTCPRCRTTSYQNPNMKLLVNICGHKLCESCVDAVFTRPSASCPECFIPLRRNQYREQQFEDSYVEKEVEIRKKILKDYNKTEEDFPSLGEYNDYLEDVETIIFNLANNIDVELTKERVEEYKKQNQSMIIKNRQKLLRKEQIIRTELDMEKEEQELRNQQAQQEILDSIKTRKQQQENLIHELMSTSSPAEEIVAKAKNELDKESTSISKSSLFSKPEFQKQMGEIAFEPLPTDLGSLYSYEPLLIETYGPLVPDMNELENYGYLTHVSTLEEHNIGGGFLQAHACQRALQDAFTCLNFSLQQKQGYYN